MSEPADTPQGEALRWVRYGQQDLDAARLLAHEEQVPPRLACFHAQQAAEKALKALLVVNEIHPPRTHSLAQIRALVPGGVRLNVRNEELADLSVWAVEPRYPTDLPEASREEANRAVELARAVVQAVSADLETRLRRRQA